MKTPLLNSKSSENENENEMVILSGKLNLYIIKFLPIFKDLIFIVENTALSDALSKRAQFMAAARESVSFDLNRNSTCNYQTIVNTSDGISSPTSSNGGNATILNRYLKKRNNLKYLI